MGWISHLSLKTSWPSFPGAPSVVARFFSLVSSSSLEGVVGLSLSSFSVWNVSLGSAASPVVVSVTGLLPACGGVKCPTVGLGVPDPPGCNRSFISVRTCLKEIQRCRGYVEVNTKVIRIEFISFKISQCLQLNSIKIGITRGNSY